MKTCFRIYTENKKLWDIERLTSQYFEGATIYTGRGIYDGEIEESCIIEILYDGGCLKKVVQFADELKKLNNQKMVLITRHEVGVIKI